MIGPLQKIARIANVPAQRSRSSGSRAAEVNFGSGVAHAPRKVAVHRRQGAFTRRQYTVVPADTGATTGSADRGASLNERFQVAQAHRLQVNLARSGNNHHARLRVKRLTPHNVCGDSKIVKAPVRTGAEKYLVDPHVLDLLDRDNIVDIRRTGDQR